MHTGRHAKLQSAPARLLEQRLSPPRAPRPHLFPLLLLLPARGPPRVVHPLLTPRQHPLQNPTPQQGHPSLAHSHLAPRLTATFARRPHSRPPSSPTRGHHRGQATMRSRIEPGTHRRPTGARRLSRLRTRASMATAGPSPLARQRALRLLCSETRRLHREGPEQGPLSRRHVRGSTLRPRPRTSARRPRPRSACTRRRCSSRGSTRRIPCRTTRPRDRPPARGSTSTRTPQPPWLRARTLTTATRPPHRRTAEPSPPPQARTKTRGQGLSSPPARHRSSPPSSPTCSLPPPPPRAGTLPHSRSGRCGPTRTLQSAQ